MGIGAIAWLIALLGLGVAAVWLMMSSRQLRDEINLPDGDIMYRDTRDLYDEDEDEPVSSSWGRAYEDDRTLVDEQFGLLGRPDYILNDNGALIPVEIKSTKSPQTPYPSHIMQVAAYCWLVEAVYEVRPTHGIIQYRDQSFDIPYDESLEIDLINVVNRMRDDAEKNNVPRSHNTVGKCRACPIRDQCGDALL